MTTIPAGDDLRRLIETETAGWDAASVQALHDAIEKMDAPGGWRPFYCPRELCDGRPHDNWGWEHARWDQHPPTQQEWGDAYVLAVLSGRGTGKTRMGSEWVHRFAKNNPGCYMALVAPTVDSARDVIVEGQSGVIRTAHPAFAPVWEPSKRKLTWPNGSVAQTFSADMPERLRGPQSSFVWMDEAAAFRNFEETWSNALFGLRLGVAPKVLLTTTPRPRQWLRDLVANPQTLTRRVSTYANIQNLAETYKTTVIRRYEGTTLGQQELEGVILEDDFGESLWMESDFRVAEPALDDPELGWHVIGVDPAVTSGGDETGIVVAAATTERDPAKRHAVVLGDHTVTDGGPDVWVRKVINVYRVTPQPCIVVVEANQGGELIGGMIHQLAPDIPVSYARAVKSKEIRADPIVLAYRMGRVKHRPGLSALQEQMCLSAETEVITPAGPTPIKGLVGQSGVQVLGGDGHWHEATAHHYGIHPLYRITVSRYGLTKTIDATATHRWFVNTGSTKSKFHVRNVAERTTEMLVPGDRLITQKPKNLLSNLVGPEALGVMSGFVFGDGWLHHGTSGVAFYGEKQAVMPWFGPEAWATSQVMANGGRRMQGLPAFFKGDPDPTWPASTLYGWLAGYFAADGSVSKTQVAMTSASRDALVWVQHVAFLLGIGCSAVSTERPATSSMHQGQVIAGGPTWSVTLVAADLCDAFFIRADQRRAWQALPKRPPSRAHWKVESVVPAGEDDTYCMNVPSDSRFVLADTTILSGNCTWIPGVSKESPGRIDSLVWALHSLLIDPRLLRSYGRVRTVGNVTNIREFAIRRSGAAQSVSETMYARQRAGLRPPLTIREEPGGSSAS